MTRHPIVLAGEPVLRSKSKKVKTFGPELQALVDDMLESMHAVSGLGLAAPQIGVPMRVIVIEMPPEVDEQGREVAPGELYVYCNPEITSMEGEEEMEERCLSLPGYVGTVKRATSVVVKGQDARGRKIRTKAKDLLAQAFQHEIDHLDGILYIDRVASPDKLRREGVAEDQEEEQA